MSMPEKFRSFTNRWGPAIIFCLTALSAVSLVFTAAAWHTLDGRYVTKADGAKEYAPLGDFRLLEASTQRAIKDAEAHIGRPEYDRERVHTDEKFTLILKAIERLQDTVESIR